MTLTGVVFIALDELDQLARARDRRADAERAARRPVPRARAVRGVRGLARHRRHRARGLDDARARAGSTRSPSARSTRSSSRCSWPCSSTGAGTPASRSTRRPGTRSASRVGPRCSRRSSCSSPTSASPSPRCRTRGSARPAWGSATRATPTTSSSPLKDALFGPWAWLLVVAVMISAISSTQTTILPTARGTLAMAVYKALPKRFATVHPRFRTPSFSTLLMGVRGDRVLRRA